METNEIKNTAYFIEKGLNINDYLTPQTISLLKEWNGIITGRLNSLEVLKTERATLVQEVFNGEHYSRVHRDVSGKLIIEERKKGSMYASAWRFEQDFSELETALKERMKSNKL